MKLRKITKNGYKVVRSVLFTAIALVIFIYVALYVTLSIPSVQQQIKSIGEEELSKLFGSELTIGSLNISPFNEVIIDDVTLYTPQGEKCIAIGTVGAGISLWDLVVNREIIITYAELIGLDGRVWQTEEGGPLNIQFIIDAFAPKDKNKPPTKFRLDIRNIVIRKSDLSFDRRYIPSKEDETIDFNHLKIKSLSADVALPIISNDTISVDLRRLAFAMERGVQLRHLSMKLNIDPTHLSIKDFELRLPGSQIHLNDLSLQYPSIKEITEAITEDTPLQISMTDSWVTPSDLQCFFPPLAGMHDRYNITLNASAHKMAMYINDLQLSSDANGLLVALHKIIATPPSGKDFSDPSSLSKATFLIGDVKIDVPADATISLKTLTDKFANGNNIRQIADNTKFVRISMSGEADLERMFGDLEFEATTGAGEVIGSVYMPGVYNGTHEIILKLEAKNLMLKDFVKETPVDNITATIDADVVINPNTLSTAGRNPLGAVMAGVPSADVKILANKISYKETQLADLTVDLKKSGKEITLAAHSPNEALKLDLDAKCDIDGDNSTLALTADTENLHLGLFSSNPSLQDAVVSGAVRADITGWGPDDISGTIDLSNLSYISPSANKDIHLNSLALRSIFTKDGIRQTELRSDWINGEVTSTAHLSDIIPAAKEMVRQVLPQTLANIKSAPADFSPQGGLSFSFTISKNVPWSQIAKLPVTPLYNITIGGEMDLAAGTSRVGVDAPYLQQGRDKLIRESRVDIKIADRKANVDLHSVIPTKKGILHLNAGIGAHDDTADITLDFNPDTKGGFYGTLNMKAAYYADLNPSAMKATLQFLPSSLYLNGTEWNVAASDITYLDKRVEIDGFTVAHDNQHININGVASASPDDVMVVDLSEVNLNYIFDTLNINYVTFGGTATGQAVASGAFSGNPDAHTKDLFVKNLSYNNCVLGDGKMRGDFDIKRMRVGIGASIDEAGRHVADIDGGIWIDRDSLSFGIDADKVRINFLQKFMAAFSSEVSGRASGKGLLYGTFKDIDMTGRFFADTISLKVDYTNVTYSGSDSVVLTPGSVRIPQFRLHDRYGNSALLSGELTHYYFHEPSFNFSIKQADKLLLYDTNAQMNSIWYGRIFGSGSGMIIGSPTLVEIIADMATQKGSDFTFVLDDTLEATDYTFLTFTDRHKEMLAALDINESEEDEIVAAFNRKVEQQQQGESAGFAMDIRATVTPDVKMTLVMDPAAGDKITARGEGPLNLTYASENDEMRMYGKYTLEEGKYNFTLQDLILKDFIIKPGSSVSFNGDPMAAMLDIRAAYRVNTNLTDLDRSFATDRDLNRTNVPVDAMLLVNGDMTNPDIKFDIELPTLNEEVAQKVRSIISSEDMMNRQIIYLLALNRFYSPEYMGNSSNGGEWASVASSTLSSQIQNILGQLTDKFTVAPSLHSDKGDFSDLEVDVALSSRLFNNRLLINGNLGYRDPSTSSTTFVGDFDVEYLLTQNGNLRLKAYNHFNDQNYYLKSALTTQGVGIIFRRDFDDLLPRRKKKRK